MPDPVDQPARLGIRLRGDDRSQPTPLQSLPQQIAEIADRSLWRQAADDWGRRYLWLARVDTLPDLDDWLAYARGQVPIMAQRDEYLAWAAARAGRERHGVPELVAVVSHAHRLAADLAGRLGLAGKPAVTTGPVSRLWAEAELDRLQTWARDHATDVRLAPAAPYAAGPKYLSHNEAVGRLRLPAGTTPKQASKVMERVRRAAAGLLRSRPPATGGDAWQYEEESWAAVVRIIQARGGINKLDGSWFDRDTDPPEAERQALAERAKAVRSDNVATRRVRPAAR